MDKSNDWKQLAQDDLEQYERRQNAKPDLAQKAVNVLMAVGLICLAVAVGYIVLEIDRVVLLWRINR